MSIRCARCEFTTNFESALTMHCQLHHEEPTRDIFSSLEMKKPATLPAMSRNLVELQASKEFKPPARTSSATRLFDRLRARICRGRTLFAHPEDPAEDGNDLCMLSECTSKGFKDELPLSCVRSDLARSPSRETFGCHLCDFEADRITILDRHLLNDHKIGIDNLLKLVMAKTTDGLTEDTSQDIFRRKPYYKPQDQLEEGEFIIETVAPKVKILKHAATNTENIGLTDNFKIITTELEKIANCPTEACDKNELFMKMQTLNECMCKFVDSSNMLKKVLNKEFDTKSRSEREPIFDLRLGDSPRDW